MTPLNMAEPEYIKRHKLINKEAGEKFREISDEEWDVTSDLLFGKDRHKYTEDNTAVPKDEYCKKCKNELLACVCMGENEL